MPTPKKQAESSPSAVSLSDVLIAFQKSLSRAQSHSASVRRTPEFFLGQRPLLDIDGLEVDLKVGLSMDAPQDDAIKVNFNPTESTASTLRFRVKAKPLDMMETGVVLFRSIEPGRTDQICAVSVVESRATPGKINLHVLTNQNPKLTKRPRNAARSADHGEKGPAIAEDGTKSWNAETNTLTFQGILTDNKGTCQIIPSIRQGKLVLKVNGQDFTAPAEAPEGLSFKNGLIYASVGSSNSERIDLFPPAKS